MTAQERKIERAKMVQETVGALEGLDKKNMTRRIAKRLYLDERTIRRDLKMKY